MFSKVWRVMIEKERKRIAINIWQMIFCPRAVDDSERMRRNGMKKDKVEPSEGIRYQHLMIALLKK
jgi:hypothetical protein